MLYVSLFRRFIPSAGRKEFSIMLMCYLASPACSISFIPFIVFLPSKSLTQVCHFFRNFIDFLPVENFFELSTSYQQCTFFAAVFENASAD